MCSNQQSIQANPFLINRPEAWVECTRIYWVVVRRGRVPCDRVKRRLLTGPGCMWWRCGSVGCMPGTRGTVPAACFGCSCSVTGVVCVAVSLCCAPCPRFLHWEKRDAMPGRKRQRHCFDSGCNTRYQWTKGAQPSFFALPKFLTVVNCLAFYNLASTVRTGNADTKEAVSSLLDACDAYTMKLTLTNSSSRVTFL